MVKIDDKVIDLQVIDLLLIEINRIPSSDSALINRLKDLSELRKHIVNELLEDQVLIDDQAFLLNLYKFSKVNMKNDVKIKKLKLIDILLGKLKSEIPENKDNVRIADLQKLRGFIVNSLINDKNIKLKVLVEEVKKIDKINKYNVISTILTELNLIPHDNLALKESIKNLENLKEYVVEDIVNDSLLNNQLLHVLSYYKMDVVKHISYEEKLKHLEIIDLMLGKLNSLVPNKERKVRIDNLKELRNGIVNKLINDKGVQREHSALLYRYNSENKEVRAI